MNTSIPETSFTSNRLPVFESVIVSNSPFEPETVNIVFPLLLCVKVVAVSEETIFESSTVVLIEIS